MKHTLRGENFGLDRTKSSYCFLIGPKAFSGEGYSRACLQIGLEGEGGLLVRNGATVDLTIGRKGCH